MRHGQHHARQPDAAESRQGRPRAGSYAPLFHQMQAEASRCSLGHQAQHILGGQ